MEQENTQGVTTDAGTSTGQFDVAGAFFGAEAAPADDQGAENSTETQLDGAETTTLDTSDDGNETALDTGTGEAETVEVWNFNGTEYTQDQVSDAIKHRETFERFNQSIAPLIDNIKAVGQQTERLQLMAITETDKMIEELEANLASGRLAPDKHQMAYQQLREAKSRKAILVEAADAGEKARTASLVSARRHNAMQVATNLAKSGWTKDQMNRAQALAQSAMKPEQFADVLTPEFMAILNDAAELRAQKAKAAAKLQDKAQKVVKVNGTKTTQAKPTTKKAEVGSSDWMSKTFWGGAK